MSSVNDDQESITTNHKISSSKANGSRESYQELCFICSKSYPEYFPFYPTDLLSIYEFKKKYKNSNPVQNRMVQDKINMASSEQVIQPCKCNKSCHWNCFMNFFVYTITTKCNTCETSYNINWINCKKSQKTKNKILFPYIIMIIINVVIFIMGIVFLASPLFRNEFYFWNYILCFLLLIISLFWFVFNVITIRKVLKTQWNGYKVRIFPYTNQYSFKITDKEDVDKFLVDKHECDQVGLLEGKFNNSLFINTSVRSDKEIKELIIENNNSWFFRTKTKEVNQSFNEGNDEEKDKDKENEKWKSKGKGKSKGKAKNKTPRKFSNNSDDKNSKDEKENESKRVSIEMSNLNHNIQLSELKANNSSECSFDEKSKSSNNVVEKINKPEEKENEIHKSKSNVWGRNVNQDSLWSYGNSNQALLATNEKIDINEINVVHEENEDEDNRGVGELEGDSSKRRNEKEKEKDVNEDAIIIKNGFMNGKNQQISFDNYMDDIAEEEEKSNKKEQETNEDGYYNGVNSNQNNLDTNTNLKMNRHTENNKEFEVEEKVSKKRGNKRNNLFFNNLRVKEDNKKSATSYKGTYVKQQKNKKK